MGEYMNGCCMVQPKFENFVRTGKESGFRFPELSA